MAPEATGSSAEAKQASTRKVDTRYYDEEMARLQVELVQQEYIRAKGLEVVVIFE